MTQHTMTVRLMGLLAILSAAGSTLSALAEASPAGIVSHHPNAVQPETTISINAESQVMAKPDIAYIRAGVSEERATAREAMAAQASAMQGVFAALRRARIAERDIQTSGLELSPRYTSVEIEKEGRRHHEMRLAGYTASNQVSVRVRDLDRLGSILDSLVAAGGNTLSGVTFAIENPAPLEDEARRGALAEAIRRAELYAEVAGYRVVRIITLAESGRPGPAPMASMRRMSADSEMATTPVAGGELTVRAGVSVQFELVPGRADTGN